MVHRPSSAFERIWIDALDGAVPTTATLVLPRASGFGSCTTGAGAAARSQEIWGRVMRLLVPLKGVSANEVLGTRMTLERLALVVDQLMPAQMLSAAEGL